MVQASKGDPELRRLLGEVHRQGHGATTGLWEAAEAHLARSRHHRRPVNVGHLERIAKAQEVLLVPTKLLASGVLTKPLTVGALAFSPGAREKIQSAGGKALSLTELMAQHGDGKGVRLVA
jgi:large subunit ribosomal protein L18e